MTMRLLIVCSGNSGRISPIIEGQATSLKDNGVNIDYFTIKGRGIRGYLRNIPILSRSVSRGNYDLIHAHYSLCGIVASVSSNLPLVVSLMGSDLQVGLFWKTVIKLLNKFRWKATVVKSEKMRKSIYLHNCFVIPNAVDFEIFRPIEKDICKEKVGFDDRKHVIFVAHPERKEKNYQLAKKAFDLIKDDNIKLNVVSNVKIQLIRYYMNAADVLLLTSLWEGSPNVIKEAMACNCPIVSTDVGDVRKIIGNTEGCYISSFEPEDVAEKIKKAIAFGKRTNGRENIKHLEINSIAKKIIGIYEQVLNVR